MSQNAVDTLSAGITREIPAAHIAQFLKRFEEASIKGYGGCNCGAGCGGMEGVIDPHGHLGLTADEANAIGTGQLPALKAAIKSKLANIGSNL
ncbi:Uncharacterised protein [Burkholderia pseudomallei]|uniref:hypothetical protein n=1 Tax=Burkholderia pseudomallei TaxID=28450 RepID=UPI000F1B6106|nr:hypothetical protein [Burkholderia pseudomallei]CAJ9527792.1 Uncharacterised protein [Burkholderia pseudomallei]VBR39610.1 Uncharacterised protein [Burkholderia pseudomallei]VBT33300.1 Uncharacterised protein [Burkholderia pseudomallei]